MSCHIMSDCFLSNFQGGLFESPHFDENDVQTISHKCDVVPLAEYKQKLDREPHRLVTVYDQNDIYYLAGFYDPTSMTISFEPDIQKKKWAWRLVHSIVDTYIFFRSVIFLKTLG